MNRKLHNTFSALAATSALLVLSLLAASPMPSQTSWSTQELVVQEATVPTPRADVAARRIEERAQVLEARIEASTSAAEALAHIAAFSAEAATTAVLAAAFDQTAAGIEVEPAQPRTRSKPRRNHQSVAMPFFSFAPRG